VAKAPGTFPSHAAVNATYTPTLKLENITLTANYAWVAPATALTAGNNQTFPATYTNPSGNYLAANGSITVNVAADDTPIFSNRENPKIGRIGVQTICKSKCKQREYT